VRLQNKLQISMTGMRIKEHEFQPRFFFINMPPQMLLRAIVVGITRTHSNQGSKYAQAQNQV
jgi:hypothetical protein